MKKFMITIVVTAMVFFSSVALASMQATTKSGYYFNAPVYWVSLYNNNNYMVSCTLTATNGAQYQFSIGAFRNSGWYRINDSRARYTYRCR